MDEQEIYAAHSFSGDVCFDNSILNMVQTSFGKDIGFSFRTFRFTGADQASGDQEQTVSCELHWIQSITLFKNRLMYAYVIIS